MIQLPKQQIFELVHGGDFVATFSGRSRSQRDEGRDVQRMVLKTVRLKSGDVYQLNTYTNTQHFVSNQEQSPLSLDAMLEQCIRQEFSQVHIQTPQLDQYFRQTAQGMRSKRTRPSITQWDQVVRHDQSKNYAVNESNATDLLRELGMIGDKGHILSAMQPKYRQINHFIAIASGLDVAENQDLSVIDCGCGKAYLSIALAYYWTRLCNKTVRLLGIDSNPDVIESCRKTVHALGLENCEFVASSIDSASIGKDVDLVIALHACDTATDDALALALHHNAKAILAAPCCHHYVNEQLRAVNAPAQASVLLRDGITRERLSDLLTDSMRRDILRSEGYASELIEFVAQEHTTKNIMICAQKRPMPFAQRRAIRNEVEAARAEWGVAPKLYEVLSEDAPDMEEKVSDFGS